MCHKETHLMTCGKERLVLYHLQHNRSLCCAQEACMAPRQSKQFEYRLNYTEHSHRMIKLLTKCTPHQSDIFVVWPISHIVGYSADFY